MDSPLKSLVTPAKSILILLPTNPNFDQVAAAASLNLALNQENEASKEVNVYCPSPMIVEFNRLIGVNKIKNEIGNKNLSITFENYNPQGIEKVSWDIDNGSFKLTVVPKTNVAPPNQDQIIVSYSGVAADLVILIGGSDETGFAAIKEEDLKDAKLAHIGTKELNIQGKTISSLATTGSSISEVTANLLKNSGYKFDADMATNLLMGIEETTKEFSSEAVTADTFTLFADLMRAGGKRLSQGQLEPSQYPAGAIPEMPRNIPSSWTEPKIFKGTSVS